MTVTGWRSCTIWCSTAGEMLFSPMNHANMFLAPRLFRARRVQKSAHRRDAIGRKTHSLGVFLDSRLVRGKINAVHFVAGYVAMEPLDLGTHSLQNIDRFFGDFPQLLVGQTSSSRNFAFDDEFGHLGSPNPIYPNSRRLLQDF